MNFHYIFQCLFHLTGKMAQMEQQLPLPMPDLSTLRITTAVSMLGKAYGCGQCNGKFYSNRNKKKKTRNTRNFITNRKERLSMRISLWYFWLMIKKIAHRWLFSSTRNIFIINRYINFSCHLHSYWLKIETNDRIR